MNATEWEGGYNRTFAKVAVRQMLAWLRAHVTLAAATAGSYPVAVPEPEVHVDEQAFEEPESYDYDPDAQAPGSAESWSANELPESNRERP